MQDMQGIIAAVPTPINTDGQPVETAFLKHCRWMFANGCDGLNILGSTGEANSFSTRQRLGVMQMAAQGLERDRLMVGTGTPSLTETIDLTKAADDMGYGVALVLPPYYYTPASDAGLIAWYLALDHALAERDIEIYFYNYPQMTGIPIPLTVIAELAELRPQRFTGIKDSSGDLDYCRSIRDAVPALRVFPSSETSISAAHAAGFAGCISASVNISIAQSVRAWRDRASPDDALMQDIAARRGAVAAHPLIPAVKYMVGRRLGDDLWNNVLPPFMPLDAAARATLDQTLG